MMMLDEETLEDGPGVVGLPEKFMVWRHNQSFIMAKIVGAISSGHNFVVAELPTGSGKTMISMAARQILEKKTLYICTTKSLQDQFLADFPHAKLIKGRANYPCGQFPDKFPNVTADDCPARKCTMACPYASAKNDAIHAQIAVMNMSYFLAEMQHIGAFKNRGLLIIDECDTLEDALLEQVSVQVSEFDVDFLNVGKVDAPEFKTKFESWKIWAEKAREKVKERMAELEREIETYNTGYEDDEDWSTLPIVKIRERKRLERLYAKLMFFLKNVDQYWVWEKVSAWRPDKKIPDATFRQGEKWVFKPVRVDQFGDIVFTAGQNFILMSATILDSFQFEKNVGLHKYREEGKVAFIRMGSVFDASKRPVIIRKGPDLTYKNADYGMTQLPKYIKEILDAHPNEKGVIHAVTYKIAQALEKTFPDRVITHSSSTRREVIETFKRSTQPLVLVSPSVDRGEDFPDDICRFIVIVKTPYPSLGDQRIKRRLYHKDGQRWYTLKTVSKIVQMTGRGMRHEEDYCISYILDPAFKKLFLSNQSLFPQWWKDALIWKEKGAEGGVEIQQGPVAVAEFPA